MNDTHEDRLTVYEIGYLIAGTLPEDRVAEETAKVKKLIADAGSTVVSEEAPKRQRLAYTIRRKTVSGSYEKYDEAYFGWIKFELGSGSIETLKKAVEVIPSVVRMLLITTVRENTYLGKQAPAVAPFSQSEERTAARPVAGAVVNRAAPVSVEDMDKSIDEMVKEA